MATLKVLVQFLRECTIQNAECNNFLYRKKLNSFIGNFYMQVTDILSRKYHEASINTPVKKKKKNELRYSHIG